MSDWTAPVETLARELLGLARARAEAGPPQQALGLLGAEAAAVDRRPAGPRRRRRLRLRRFAGAGMRARLRMLVLITEQ